MSDNTAAGFDVKNGNKQSNKKGHEDGTRDIGWISVKDRLPEASGWYLVFTRAEQCSVLSYSTRHMAFNAYDELPNTNYAFKTCTHWMPLPEPPECYRMDAKEE